MAEKVTLVRTVLDKVSLLSTVDAEFTTFTPPTPPKVVDQVEEFFKQYDQLYLEIPIEGRTNSHQYLIEQSSKIYQVSNKLAEIQPLLDEIAQLRRQLLESQQENVNLRLQQARNV